MGDNKKIYTIEINGIEQSIKQVDALSDALKSLDTKIKDLESKNINVSSTSNGGGRTNSEFDAQDKLEKQILDTEQKIAQVRDENYKKLLHMKEELKEYTQIAKSNAAADENKQGLFDTNTMAGMKASLKSIKAEMQTLDVSSDRFRELTQEANGLNEKLKSIEQSYGQFGRNVGNYANGVADGLQQVVIKVGDVDRTFESAKQASRELGNELKTMAANGEQGTQEFKNLQKAVATLNSDMKDAMVSSRAMDNLLDTMKGFASVGQVTQGFSALFGFDDSEIERSIQKLVALQNVMQGLEEINQQMQSGEGIGGWIAKGNDAIDAFVKKLLGAKTAQEGLNTTMTAGKTASEGLAAAETAQAAATTTATVATKALSLALKTIGIGLVISAVAYLITYWKEIYKWFTDTIPALKNLSDWFDKIKAVAMGVGNAILNYMVQPLATLVKVIKAVINGNFSEIPNIISNGIKKTFNIVGNFQKGYYRETERQQEAHNKKMREKQKEANEEFLKDEEAKYGKSHKRTQEYYKKQMALTEKGSKEYKELQRKLWEDERQEREENARKNVASSKRVTAQTKKIDFDAEKEIVRVRIDAMKEGLNKTITQLEEERKDRIAKIRANGKNYKEVEAEINALYDKKILDAKEEWSFKIQQVYLNMWKRIYDINHNSAQMNFETELRDLETQYTKLQNEATKMLDKNTASYSSVLGNITSMTAGEIGLPEAFFDKQTLASAKEYIDMLQKIQILEGNIKETMSNPDYSSDEWLQVHVRLLQKAVDTEKQKLNEWLEKNKQTEESMEKLSVVKALREQNYSKTLLREYKLRIQNRKQYYDEIQRLSIEELDKQYEIEERKAVENYNNEWRTMTNAYSAQDEELKKHLKNSEITQAQYDEAVKRLTEERLNAETALFDKYNSLREQREQEHQNKIKHIVSNAYNSRIQEYRDFMSRLNQSSSSSVKVNAWGFPNLKKMKQEIQQEKQAYQQLTSDILNEKHRLQASLDANEISFDNFQQAQRELNNLQSMVANGLEGLKEKEENYRKALLAAINMWVQAVGQTINSILSSLSEIESNEYDKRIEQQEKYIEEYEELLDKQKDITQEHADAVDSIEDELSTARGDRRQQLIDQLNAEMAAQRASLAQEKKIEKEREKAEEKKKKLEHDQAVAKKKMQEAQAYINMAMAISMAAVNNWPIPAIPMMALAAAAGAAQIAAIKSQNIPSYGSGGVIQGKSHREGGVKVLGGQAEVEGGEFITNKVTTSKNVDLLEYINTKRKKISLEDLIDFYGGNSQVKKSITTVRTKFADGGMIPTLRNDINLSDRMLTAFEDYSNRPVQVAVVDIIDRTQAVNDVRVMAGLE